MVWPMIAAAAIGAGGNLLGGLMGHSAQDKANATNWQIALMNYYQQEAARREAQTEARRQEGEGKLGSTDAFGNRTYFKPGVGWVTERSKEQEELAGLYEREELAQLMQDLPAKRAQMFKNLARQGREENAAGGIMEAMLRNYRRDPSQAVGRRNRMSAEAANEGFDTAMTQAMVDAQRTGTGGQAKIASQMGRDKYKALRTAFMENAEGATEAEEERYMNEQANYANRYNQLATRASAMPDAQYNPRNLEGMNATALQQAMTGGRSGSNNLLQAMSQAPANLNFKAEPNLGLATAIANAGSSISAIGNYYDSTRGQGQQNYGNYAQRNYFPSAPSSNTPRSNDYYKQNVGAW